MASSTAAATTKHSSATTPTDTAHSPSDGPPRSGPERRRSTSRCAKPCRICWARTVHASSSTPRRRWSGTTPGCCPNARGASPVPARPGRTPRAGHVALSASRTSTQNVGAHLRRLLSRSSRRTPVVRFGGDHQGARTLARICSACSRPASATATASASSASCWTACAVSACAIFAHRSAGSRRRRLHRESGNLSADESRGAVLRQPAHVLGRALGGIGKATVGAVAFHRVDDDGEWSDFDAPSVPDGSPLGCSPGNVGDAGRKPPDAGWSSVSRAPVVGAPAYAGMSRRNFCPVLLRGLPLPLRRDDTGGLQPSSWDLGYRAPVAFIETLGGWPS